MDRKLKIVVVMWFILCALFVLVKVKTDDWNAEQTTSVAEEESTTAMVEESYEDETVEIFREGLDIEDETSEIEETTIDIHSLVTSIQYTLGYGVRCRLSPSEEGTIYKTIQDIFTEVEVIDRDENWYRCVVDDREVYINWRYIGDENDVAMIKDKISLENERKKSAYYQAFKNMTDDEYDLLARILALEAGDEDFKGKLAVVEVVFNRVISANPQWPDTVGEVLLQKGQFTTTKYLSHPYKVPDDSDYEAIEYVRQHGATAIREFLDAAGMTDINSLDYVFFATYKANGTDFIKHGGHYFSRSKSKKYRHAVYKK